jgi:hypothetical protein
MARRLVPGLLVFVACAAASDTPPKPPDLYGALIVSSNYRYYASILYASGSEARRSALASCKADEPQATCTVYANFKNQCIAVAANGPHHFVATGKEDWDRQRTRDFSLQLCREKSGSECRLLISACSTQAQKVEDQGIRTDSGSPEIEGFQARLSPLVPR